jgi:2-dehydropantoate 2-reductase
MKFNTAAIVGAGAVGSFYGAKLQQSGMKVQYQTRGSASVLRKDKMHIQSTLGDFSLSADAYESTQTMDPADLVIVTVKAQDNIDYYTLINPLIKFNSVILLLQNGLNLDERLHELFPNNSVLGAAAFVCLNRISATDIRHFAYGRLDIGYLKLEDESLADDIVKLFRNAGLDVQYAGNIRAVRWKKLLWNVPFNVLSVLLLKANTKEMIEDENINRLAVDLMKEVQAIALADGIVITDDDIYKMIEHTKVMVPYKTSMLLDFEEHRPMEVEAILGEPLKTAKMFSISAPRMEVLYAELKFFDTHRR